MTAAAPSPNPRPAVPGVEILAPAGDEAMLSAAVRSGADAVYLGFGGFNARRGAGNFGPDTLPAAVGYCRARGVRVHVALNTLAFGSELADLAGAVRCVAAAGADAVIADDLAVRHLVRAIAPDLPLHASTQMSVHSPAGVRALAALGYARVILARELTLDEIKACCAAGREAGIECEVFLHGALCFAISGQCMLSAFLGGRSGNRGACAGPCRLPFDADPALAGRPGVPGTACHLSLKDMDHIPHLRELADAGVASVKIEGRLRTPEYAAAAVAACRAARGGLPYDAALLRDVFSRSGFTDGYLTGRRDGRMFGVRTAADAAATRAALPRARELYRREFARVPVDFALTPDCLTAADRDGHSVSVPVADAFRPAAHSQREAIEKALRRTGGTPFVAADLTVDPALDALFLPAAAWNALRRQALEQLLALRAAPRPRPVRPYALPAFAAAAKTPRLAAYFTSWAQVPAPWAEKLAFLVLPLGQAPTVPDVWRGKTLLALPRVTFGPGEAALRAALTTAVPQGFAGYVLGNPAHLTLAAAAKAAPLYGGLGLNVTNPLAAAEYTALGLRGLLLHPETPLAEMTGFGKFTTAALVYGHLPVMLTRACPRHNVRGCAGCDRAGTLRDRKGRDLALRCELPANDVRTLYNPVPVYMGDRLRALPVDWALAYFTRESRERAAQVLETLAAGAAFDSEFTRGLYYTKP